MATGPEGIDSKNLYAKTKVYRESFLNDGTHIRTFRRGDEGKVEITGHETPQELREINSKREKQIKDIGRSCGPAVNEYDPGIMWYANEVSNPRSDEIETYNFRSLEEAMDHHDYLVEQDGSFTGSNDYRDIGRFGQIQLDIESEE